jgi:hypothetical protein
LAAAHRGFQRVSKKQPRTPGCFGFGFGFGFGCCLLLIFSAFKASRAPQADRVVEAPCLSVASLGAVPDQTRSTGHRRQSGGECQAQAVLATFAKTKVARAVRRESL